MRKKKLDPLTIALYGIIVFAVIYVAAALGAAMDLSVDEKGVLNFSALMSQLETVLTEPDSVFAGITDFNSFCFKIPLMVSFALGIYALMKSTSKKRLHRKGVEHGSARWATEKEEKALADKPPKDKTQETIVCTDSKKRKFNYRPIKDGDFIVFVGKKLKWYNIRRRDIVNIIAADFGISEEDAAKIVKRVKKRFKGEFETDNNILLTQEVRMSLNTRQHRENLNVLVIGGSGSGKSRFYVKPNLMQLNTSYVVTDPKGELLRSCGKLMEKAGYEIRVFNLIDMLHSHNYNPFNYVYDMDGNVNKTYVLKMINCLMKNTKQEGSSGGDQFWDDATKSLTLAIAFYLLEKSDLNTMEEKAKMEKAKAVYEKAPTEENKFAYEDLLDEYEFVLAKERKDCNFTRVMQVMKMAEISEQDDQMQSPLDDLMNEHNLNYPHSMAFTYYQDFKKAPAETAKSILISAAVRFAAFELPEVADLTHTDNIQLDTLGDKKTALFVLIPSSDATFNFLAAMMYTQLFDTLYDTANFKYGGRLPVHVRCLLDEFANVGTIPDFDKLLATMRSMEISANIIIQNLAQLKKMYDKSWEIVTGNCDSLLFLGGQEASTLEAISKSLGKETIDVVSQNRTKSHKSPSTSENNSILGRELMTTDELKVMKPNECVLIVRALYPFHCHKFDIEKHPNYRYLEDSNKKYAYEISGLHTEKAPDERELQTEEFYPQDNSQEAAEEMKTDIDIPKEVVTVDDEFANEQAAFKEIGATDNLLFKNAKNDTLADEQQPIDLEMVDMSKPEIYGEADMTDFYGL